MSTLTSLACIGGGQMAEALIRGVVAAELLAPEQISVIEPNPDRLKSLQQNYGIQAAADPAELCSRSQVLLAAVKPQAAAQALSAYAPHLSRKHLLISIMAGISLANLVACAGPKVRLIRAMPNTPALVLAGATAFSPAASATREDCELARAIFDAVGVSLELPELQINAVTGLSGSAKLALESGEHAAVLKGKVTSPGGTTIAGIQALEQGAFRGVVMEAVRKAAQRSAELGG